MRISSLLLCLGALLGQQTLPGQTTDTHTVQAVGNATLAVTPDQAELDVGVITNANTAQEAAQLNATQSTAMQNALKQALGSAGSFQTVSYSVYPRYSNTVNQPPTIVGYAASNTIRVTTVDLSIIGKLIDAANQAGANTVGGLSFGLQDPDPATQQALGIAAKQALAHAAAIATGLGAKTGAVLSAQQGSSYTPIVVGGVAAGAATATPVQTGTVNVYATVTVTVALTQ